MNTLPDQKSAAAALAAARRRLAAAARLADAGQEKEAEASARLAERLIKAAETLSAAEAQATSAGTQPSDPPAGETLEHRISALAQRLASASGYGSEANG